MKVLIISPQNPYPPIDGGKIGIFYPLMVLKKHGVSIALFFLYYKRKPDTVVKFLQEKNIKTYPFRLNTSDSVSKVIRNILSSEPFKMAKYFNQSALNYLKRVFQEVKPDIIQTHHTHMAKYAVELKKQFNIPIILREHNIEYLLVKQFYKSESNPVKKLVAYWQYLKTFKYENETWNYFDRIIFMSPIDEMIAKSVNPKIKSVVIQDGVDIEEFHPLDLEKEPLSLIFSGNLKTIQNLESILWFIRRVWPLIKEKEPKSKLYITGGEEVLLCKRLKTNIDDLNNEGIFPLGFVEDVKETISRFQIFISPTRMGSGIRIKVLNAMALGMPVVCTPLDAEAITGVKDGEHLLVADDFKKFAESILQLFHNRDLRYKLGTNARKLIEYSFGWDRYAEKFINIYKEIIHQ